MRGVGSAETEETAYLSQCTFLHNTAPLQRGGAIHITYAAGLYLTDSNFTGNSAVIGGAIAAVKLFMESTALTVCNTVFSSNIALPPFTPGPSLPVTMGEPGSGGAVYVDSAICRFTSCVFQGNQAMYGGAISSRSVTLHELKPDSSTPLPDYAVASVRALGLTGAASLPPFGNLFFLNRACLGGAIYTIDSVSLATPDSTDNGPPVASALFAANTALGGGAVYFDRFVHADYTSALFYNNTAVTSIKLQDIRYEGALLPSTASRGSGGAVVAVGRPGGRMLLSQAVFQANTAVDGGAIFVAPGAGCQQQAGCYTATLSQVEMSNNSVAGGGGGAIYWVHPDVLDIQGCAGNATPSLVSLPLIKLVWRGYCYS